MLISVIIPVLNQEKFIGRCLRSILQQTLDRNFYEILVVNDGSTDKTSYALELFGKEITVINNKKNIGLPASVNKGIKKSKGKYIIRLDSDDYVNENFLNILFVYITSNQADAVSCDYLIVDDNENVIKKENCLRKPIGCGILFQKAHLENIGLYDNKFLYQEDKELRLRFEKKYKISRLNLPLYRYRMHTSNMTKNKNKMKDYQKKLLIKHKSN
tara:strand:- start:423 stop:1067 length:645 start_codon:yes stop_codon:yes gene_type:complete